MNETVKATISAAVVVIANVLAMVGITIDQGVVTDGICGVVMLAATVWGIWKNHNFTAAAQEGQLVTDAVKHGGGDLPADADETSWEEAE